MPLNSSHLDDDVIKTLQEIPEDDECFIDERHSSLELMPYQTKVQIYDEKCGGCGFVRVDVLHYNPDSEKKIVFNDINKAIEYATRNNCKINRTCSYLYNRLTRNGKHIYPTLSEIVSNTCEFWNKEKLTSMTEDEEFVEIDEVEKIIVRIPKEWSI
ncbi:MAG: hypothetical protein ACYDBX_04675 [Patescibacteria group bacterium]